MMKTAVKSVVYLISLTPLFNLSSSGQDASELAASAVNRTVRSTATADLQEFGSSLLPKTVSVLARPEDELTRMFKD